MRLLQRNRTNLTLLGAVLMSGNGTRTGSFSLCGKAKCDCPTMPTEVDRDIFVAVEMVLSTETC